ncbi:MAG: hypothetical protein H7301_13885 [Cryobacterium sp.]|nr:hypothetical protein [Oligoflexia bacterium]
MRLAANDARAFVFGPAELAGLVVEQFLALGFRAERARTPLNEEELFSWLEAHRSEASTFVHPGLSFWADRPEFPQLVSASGFFPICPSPRLLSLCLNKLNVILEAEAAGIPHLAISTDPLSSVREIEAAMAETGERYPVLLKSMKAAQGHGILLVANEVELREFAPLWFEQLSRRYSEASVLIERCLPSARHVLVPFAANFGRFLEVFPILDASLQSRWRRMLQFIPAVGLSLEAAKTIRAEVVAWVNHLEYSGFGSLEFLVDGDRVYLIDACARMNADFPLWEGLTGARSVEWQLAALGQLPVPKSSPSDAETHLFGAGIAMRIYAEDPIRSLPCPGLIRELTPPFKNESEEHSVRWLTRYAEGEEVLWTSNGVIGELFVLAKSRQESLRISAESLSDLWIAGSLQTNQRFLLEHLEHPFVRENLIHAGFTDEDFVPESAPRAELLNLLAALADELFGGGGVRWVANGRWMTPESSAGEWVEKRDFISAQGRPGVSGRVIWKSEEMRVLFEPMADDRWLVHFGAWSISIRRVRPESQANSATKLRKILALAPGRIHGLLCQPGDVLEPRARACLLESLGDLIPHSVPVRVRLLEWKVAPDDIVDAGHELALLEILG